MKITPTTGLNNALLASTTNRSASASSFQNALEAAKQAAAQSDASITLVKSLEKKEDAAPAISTTKTAAQELSEYLRKSPAQHMREAILQKMGLTEESLAALPPEQQAAIEKTITDKIKEMLQDQSGNTRNQAQSPLPVQTLLTSNMTETKA
ncbi:MAG: hypothetical protein WCL27_00680 [Betaproteobacteria bacterium]